MDAAASSPPAPAERSRPIRIAAVGDLHAGRTSQGELVELFASLGRSADILALCGDLTHQGRPDQMREVVGALAGIEVPIVAVLGNHDHESGEADELVAILEDRGVHVLDGDNTVIEGIGFAGIKGFGGGFGRFSINPAGEPRLREFVAEAVDQALRLEDALRTLTTDEKVVLMHYAPIPATIRGEPREFYPLLGSSRFLPPLETYDASVVFHGHAHYGTPHGRTPGGIDVYNVALPLLQRNGETVRRWTGRAPERRAPGDGRAERSTE